jgi:hypothetical protein
MYYAYLKESNSLEDILNFEEKWMALLHNVKTLSRQEAETVIKSFVIWLRNIRHNKLCAERNAKVSLDKEDRQFYRADGILIIFKNNDKHELAKFKAFTESYAGADSTDPNWVKRWDTFVTAVSNETTDESKKKLLSKFLMAQRKKKMDRKHTDTNT